MGGYPSILTKKKRTSASVDKTSDIYSLGITFFQHLTGKLNLFNLSNLFSHRKTTINDKEILNCIEDIIQKMMKKIQNERYFSIIGVKKELEYIQQILQNQDLLNSFKAIQLEVDDIFKFENKLYGRDLEIQALKKIFEYVKKIILLRC